MLLLCPTGKSLGNLYYFTSLDSLTCLKFVLFLGGRVFFNSIKQKRPFQLPANQNFSLQTCKWKAPQVSYVIL